MGGNPIWKGVNHTTNSESWVGTGNGHQLSVDRVGRHISPEMLHDQCADGVF